jgi:hypothetical protein
MSKFHLLPLVLALLLTGLLPVSAQTIPTITVADRVLVNIAQPGQSYAYDFNNEAESDTTLFVTYLGQPFPFVTEWYDSSGNLLWVLPVNQSGATTPLRLPPDIITIIMSGVGSATGRVTLSLGVDAPGDTMFEAPSTMSDEPFEGDDPFYTVPQSGNWTLRYIDHENNCPNDILFEDIWMPAAGTSQTLNFSGDEANVGLELHRFVAPEIDEDPSAFEIEMGEFPGSWIVVPGIQTAPFTYYYTISAPNYIQLEYVQRLALSDCELYARFDLVEEGAATGVEPAFSDAFFDLSSWTVFGDATDLTFRMDDAEAPDGYICARDQSAGETWYFEAPPEVIATINANRGGVLEYALKLLQHGTQYDQFDVILTVGNGIILVYSYEYYPMVDSWMYYQIPLYAGAGWIDPDGGMPTDDPDLFEQMMADVTQLHIRGEFLEGSDSACLGNVRLSSWEDAALGG